MTNETKCINPKKKKDLKEEFKLIQVNIANWIRNSLYIKNWAISVWALMTVLILTQYYSPGNNNINYAYLLLITVFIPFPFWLFDALFKKFERIAIARSSAIQDFLIGSLQEYDNETLEEAKRLFKKEENNKSFMEKLKNKVKRKELSENYEIIIKNKLECDGFKFEKDFPLYDPVGRISCRNFFYKAKYLRFASTGRCLKVRIVSMIYLMLIIISLSILSVVFWPINQFCVKCPIEFPLIIYCISWGLWISFAILLIIFLIHIWYKCEKWEI